MTVVSTPACSSDIAQLWRSTCGWSFLACSDGQRVAAVAAWVATRCSIASRLSRRPVRVGNSGSAWSAGSLGEPGREHGLRWVGEWDGRCFRPLPSQRTCAPVPSVMSPQSSRSARRRAVRPGSSGSASRGRGGLPSGLVGCVDQRPASSAVRNVDRAVSRSAWAGSRAPWRSRGVLGVPQCGVFEQRADRGQPQVPACGRCCAVGLEVLEERRITARRGRPSPATRAPCRSAAG